MQTAQCCGVEVTAPNFDLCNLMRTINRRTCTEWTVKTLCTVTPGCQVCFSTSMITGV